MLGFLVEEDRGVGGGVRGNRQVAYVGEILALFIYLFTGASLIQVVFFSGRG